MKIILVAVIAHATFYANPSWGADGLPRNAAGAVISDRWIQPGESFWINPGAWVNTYQHYCHQIDQGPKLEIEVADPPAPPSNEEQKQEPAPEEPAASDTASESVAQPEADQAPPAPDQAEAKPDQVEAKPAEEPAPKPAAPPRKKKPPAPKPEADQAPPAPDQAEAKE